MTLGDGLYGELIPQAVKELMSCIPSDVKGAGKHWAYIFTFIGQYCADGNDIDPKVIEQLHKVFEKQNHSGGSWGVVMQELMKYYSGQYSDEEKAMIK